MVKVSKYIFRGYDLRGLVDKDLNPEILEHLGKAHGTFLKRHKIKKAVVSRDCRTTSEEYSQAFMRGLVWTGLDVIDIGMELVGTFYWAQYFLKCPGGAYISASHNPAEYNGVKFAINFSETMVSDSIQELRQMVETEDYKQGKKLGQIRKENIRSQYIADLVKRLPLKKKFKIVVDPSNSTAGVIAPEFFQQAGCEVICSNCDLDPSFPLGTPDPTESRVAERLREKVLETNADLGFSYDADGDRIGIVDNKGNIIWNDVLVALLAIDALHKHPGSTIIFNTLCSKVVPETIKKYGGTPFMWRTGHSFIKKKSQEIKASFAGELSGHFFFSADFYNHDDGFYTSLALLHYLAETNQTLAQAFSALPKYISSPEIKVYAADEKKVELISKISIILKKDYAQAEIIDDERAGDGVRLEMPDKMFVVRYSQNGPYITVKFEAKQLADYDELKHYINKLLHQFSEIDWQSEINVNIEAIE